MENGSSGGGDAVGIDQVIHEIFVPEGYVSGASLTDSMSFDNATLAGLDLTPGTYTWNWGSGGNEDSFTINIGAAWATGTQCRSNPCTTSRLAQYESWRGPQAPRFSEAVLRHAAERPRRY